MIANMNPTGPQADIFKTAERAELRQGCAGLGADDFGGTTGSDWDYNPGTVVNTSGNAVNTSGINWNALINQGFNLTKQIIQTQPGVYTQQGPNGTIQYVQPLGQTSNLPIVAGGTLPTILGGSGPVSTTGLIAIAAAGLVLVLVMSGGRR